MFTVYGKANCSGCNTAKDILKVAEDDFGIEYEYKSLNKDYSMQDLLGIMPRSHKSMPVITLDGEYFGGLVELQMYLNCLPK